jgi:hypothetical protein
MVKSFKPKLQTLDNEALAAFKNFFPANGVEHQLVPPHCHRRNAAERAIRTFKEHFVARISSLDPTFPLHLCDRLLPQAEITLNLLRTSRLHPQLSTAAHFHGFVDYNKTAFAPPGCKIISHEKPGKQRTWAPLRQDGCSLGPAMHHYRCQNVCIVYTLQFFPHNYQMPQLSSTDILIMAAKYIMNALQILTRECQSLMSGMVQSWHLLSWLQFSNSNYDKLHLPHFQLRLPRSNNVHALPNNPIQS